MNERHFTLEVSALARLTFPRYFREFWYPSLYKHDILWSTLQLQGDTWLFLSTMFSPFQPCFDPPRTCCAPRVLNAPARSPLCLVFRAGSAHTVLPEAFFFFFFHRKDTAACCSERQRQRHESGERKKQYREVLGWKAKHCFKRLLLFFIFWELHLAGA